MSATDSAPTTFLSLCKPAVVALRKHWKPFVLIQVGALAALVSYFYLPAFKGWCERLAAWKDEGGWVTAAIASGIAGGLVPEVAKLLTGLDAKPWGRRLRDMSYVGGFFVLNGTVVYFFYLLQSRMFGDDGRFVTTLKKVAMDQAVFTPFLSLPWSLATFTWLKHNFKWAPTAADLRPRVLVRSLPSIILPAWAYWIPMTMMIYSLPSSIQFVLFFCALGAWSLMLVFIATE